MFAVRCGAFARKKRWPHRLALHFKPYSRNIPPIQLTGANLHHPPFLLCPSPQPTSRAPFVPSSPGRRGGETVCVRSTYVI